MIGKRGGGGEEEEDRGKREMNRRKKKREKRRGRERVGQVKRSKEREWMIYCNATKGKSREGV